HRSPSKLLSTAPLDCHRGGATHGDVIHRCRCLNNGGACACGGGHPLSAVSCDRARATHYWPSKNPLGGPRLVETVQGGGRDLDRPSDSYGGRRGRYGGAGRGLLDGHVHDLGAAQAKRVCDGYLERVVASHGEGCRDITAARAVIIATEGDRCGWHAHDG